MMPPASLKVVGSIACQSKKLLACSIRNPIRFISNRFASTTMRFTKKHEWITIKGDESIGRVGISDHAQYSLGDIVYVQLPELGAKLVQFDEVGAIESVKAASELYSPVSGEVVAVNEKLEDKPSLVNKDCYGDGWLFEIKLDDMKQFDKLMDDEQYTKFLKETLP